MHLPQHTADSEQLTYDLERNIYKRSRNRNLSPRSFMAPGKCMDWVGCSCQSFAGSADWHFEPTASRLQSGRSSTDLPALAKHRLLRLLMQSMQAVALFLAFSLI